MGKVKDIVCKEHLVFVWCTCVHTRTQRENMELFFLIKYMHVSIWRICMCCICQKRIIPKSKFEVFWVQKLKQKVSVKYFEIRNFETVSVWTFFFVWPSIWLLPNCRWDKIKHLNKILIRKGLGGVKYKQIFGGENMILSISWVTITMRLVL